MYTGIMLKILLLILITIFFALAANENTFISIPYSNQFKPYVTPEGETLSVSAFTADTNFFFMYDMSDRSLVILDNNGLLIRKTPFQNIGRKTYIGDDFIVLNDLAVFLNSVDNQLEYFNINSGIHIKSVPCPANVPNQKLQRRFSKITRIFLENGQIYLGNAHSVFPFFESPSLQKKAESKVVNYSSGKSLLFFNTKTPVHFYNGNILYSDYSVPFKWSSRPFYGKHTCLVNKTIYYCTVNDTGITISRVDLTE